MLINFDLYKEVKFFNQEADVRFLYIALFLFLLISPMYTDIYLQIFLFWNL